MEGYKNLPEDSMRQDWDGKEVKASELSLKIGGHPVMERWETPFMCKLAEVAAGNDGKKGGTVLEVGLGMAISATAIQRYEPGRHLIVELNQQVCFVENNL